MVRAIDASSVPLPRLEKRCIRALLFFFLPCASAGAADIPSNPLFESDEVLPIVLELPVADVLRHAKSKPQVPGRLSYSGPDGADVVLEATVTTRGKSRLEQCRYPPLSVNLKKKQVKSTLFAGQNKLKLVVPCRTSATFTRYLAQEYATYKAYNLLTDYSFRVRLLEVTFRDSAGKRDDKVHEAFFIESLGEVANRHGMSPLKTGVVRLSQLDQEQLGIMTLFQYMIANTDWSARRGPAGEDCCHNSKVIGPPGQTDEWVVLPYDFDQAGIINTSYAAPSDQLPIRRVRQRLYRGYCRNNARLDETIALFNDRRSAIETVFGTAAQSDSVNKSVIKYLYEFYEVINDPAKRQKKITGACQKTND